MIDIKYAGLPTEVWFSITEVAKLLNLTVRDKNLRNRKKIGRNNFFKILRYNKVLLKDNTPSQSFVNLDLARLHKKRKGYVITIFSERGIDFLKQNFKTFKYIVDYDRKTVKNKYVVRLEDII